MPGREELRPEKLEAVEALRKEIDSYPVVGMLDVYKLPANAIQLINIRVPDTKIKIIKKNILTRALEKSEKKSKLGEHLQKYPGIILSKTNPFKLNKELEKNKSSAPAKEGEIAPKDIEIKAGPTDLMPGPAISTLAAAKIPAKVEAGKIAVLKDVVVTKAGSPISKEASVALQMLGIRPMEIGINLVCAYEDGTIYMRDILSIDEKKTFADIISAANAAMNLSINAGYVTKDNAEMIIIKAFNEARSLSMEAGVVSKDTIGDLLAKAVAEMKSLNSGVDIKVEEPPKEEKKEEASEEPKEEKKEGE